jgi:hypothetical protein
VTATLALFIALGGSAYAAGVLPTNSVGAKQIKKNAVTGKKIKRNAVTSSKVKNGSLSAADFKAGQIPAGKTGPAGPAGPGAATNVIYRPAVSPDATVVGEHERATASCISGERLIGGGAYWSIGTSENTDSGASISASGPFVQHSSPGGVVPVPAPAGATPAGWLADGAARQSGDHLRVWAICAKP